MGQFQFQEQLMSAFQVLQIIICMEKIEFLFFCSISKFNNSSNFSLEREYVYDMHWKYQFIPS